MSPMRRKKQRYCLVFRARVYETVSAEQKHARFFEGIKNLRVPWGLGERRAAPAPDFGRSSSAVVGLTKFFGDGVRRAMLTYRYRRMLNDDGYSDDTLIVDLDPAKVDIRHLVYRVIPTYIEALDAYLVQFFDEQFVDLAYDEREDDRQIRSADKSKEYSNPRAKVDEVWPVSFYDELLCRRAFNLSPTEVLARLEGKIEHGQLLHTGVYLVGSSQVLALEDAQKLSREMKKAIIESPRG